MDESNRSTQLDDGFRSREFKYLNIYKIFPFVLLLWLLFAVFPLVIWVGSNYFAEQTGLRPSVDWATLGTIGDMFGTANSFFSGFALIIAIITVRQQTTLLQLERRDFRLQLEEIQRSADAQEEMVKNQKSTLAASVVLPIVDQVRGAEYGNSAHTLGVYWRQHTIDAVGEDGLNSILNYFRDGGDASDPPINDAELAEKSRVEQLWRKAQSSFIGEFQRLRSITRAGEATEEEMHQWNEVNQARRVVVGVAQKIYRLSNAGIIDDPAVERVVVSSDMVALMKFVVRPLEMVLLGEHKPEKEVHDPIDHLCQLYSDRETAQVFY